MILFHKIDPSLAVQTIPRRSTQKLEHLFDRIIGCDLSLEALQQRKHHGQTVRAHLVVHLPSPDVSEERTGSQGSAQYDLILAVNRAFSAAEKMLKRQRR